MIQPPENSENASHAAPPGTDPGEFTRVLDALGRGEDHARERLLQLAYDEIHRLAKAQMRGEAPDRTLQATALLNEAYIRLFGGARAKWDNRAHFFSSAVEVMRRLLIDAARKRRADKRGGGQQRVPLFDCGAAEANDPELLLALDEALDQLGREDEQRATIVKLRFYSGLSAPETAAVLRVSLRTVEREWRYAKAWLRARLSDDESGGLAGRNALDY